MQHADTCQNPIGRQNRLAIIYLLVVTTGISLAGCVSGPDFQRPAAPDVGGYTTTPVPDKTVSAPTQLGETQSLVKGLMVFAKNLKLLL